MNDQPRFTQPMQSADILSQLPSDKTEPSPTELQIVDTLFRENPSGMKSILGELKDVAIVGALFFILSLPYLDNLIGRVFPVTLNSPYCMVGIKALVMMLGYWVVRHFYLSRKRNA